MPKLQVDGETVAEIDQVLANELLDAAKSGVGKIYHPPTFPQQVYEMRRPEPSPIMIAFTLEFARPG